MKRLVTSLRKFGRRLRELRTEKGCNQLYLATVAGLSEDFVSLVERGISQPSARPSGLWPSALETDVTTLVTFPGAQVERRRVRMVKTKMKAKKSLAAKDRAPNPGRK